ncbi:MAG TPA: hypothetical protein VGJ16_09935, partial [Pirellulales bacterium]
LYLQERDWFEKELVRDIETDASDPLAAPPIFVRSDADDRTLELHPDFRYLTVNILRRIQREFLKRQPLWRVMLIGDHRSCGIVVYPTVIRFGNLPRETDWHEGLGRVAAHAVALAEERMKPQRGEVAFLQELLPGVINRIGSQHFQLIGVRNPALLASSRLAVFVLFKGTSSDDYELDGPLGCSNDFLATSISYGVNAEGKIVSQINIPQTAAFHVRQCLPPADYRGPLAIVDERTGERHTIEIREDDIVRTPED